MDRDGDLGGAIREASPVDGWACRARREPRRMIGALGPIIRGDHKKRSRNGQVGQNYDTLLLGHWHQLIRLQRLIVNGSLKGYDEYVSAGNFPFEPPQQACWCTHPERGPTDVRPIFVEKDKRSKPRSEWVAWAA